MFLLHYLLQMLLTDGGVTVHALKCLGCLCLSSHDWWGAAAGSLLPGIVRPERCCLSTVWKVSIHNLTYSFFSVRHLFIIVINFALSQRSEDNFQDLVLSSHGGFVVLESEACEAKASPYLPRLLALEDSFYVWQLFLCFCTFVVENSRSKLQTLCTCFHVFILYIHLCNISRNTSWACSGCVESWQDMIPLAIWLWQVVITKSHCPPRTSSPYNVCGKKTTH